MTGFPSKHTQRLPLSQSPTQLPFVSLLLSPHPTCLITSLCSSSSFNWLEIFHKLQDFLTAQSEKFLTSNSPTYFPSLLSHTPYLLLPPHLQEFQTPPLSISMPEYTFWKFTMLCNNILNELPLEIQDRVNKSEIFSYFLWKSVAIAFLSVKWD